MTLLLGIKCLTLTKSFHHTRWLDDSFSGWLIFKECLLDLLVQLAQIDSFIAALIVEWSVFYSWFSAGAIDRGRPCTRAFIFALYPFNFLSSLLLLRLTVRVLGILEGLVHRFLSARYRLPRKHVWLAWGAPLLCLFRLRSFEEVVVSARI